MVFRKMRETFEAIEQKPEVTREPAHRSRPESGAGAPARRGLLGRRVAAS
jgi:hypothetical protein